MPRKLHPDSMWMPPTRIDRLDIIIRTMTISNLITSLPAILVITEYQHWLHALKTAFVLK